MSKSGLERLLALAEMVCGAAARDRVFEPLVADWQREWQYQLSVHGGPPDPERNA